MCFDTAIEHFSEDSPRGEAARAFLKVYANLT